MELQDPEIEESFNQEKFPRLIKRIQSLFIDQLFIIICIIIFSHLLTKTDEESTKALRGILTFGLFFIYEPVCISLGCTIGNKITGIRVRKFGEEKKRINIFRSYFRFIIKLFLGIISFFTVTSNAHKRALHDIASGSIMINDTKC